ncbi:hypothetical protein PF002_g23996 [Phytophthora fragariae]|uniref:Uncharacterized protein n=1 Tax=Phytophthora fragariae TaxID=53985 RepID=A0A6A3X183_9STRA|nr:hypothetical protein PF002_g23996 [Phytophthora fragariae]
MGSAHLHRPSLLSPELSGPPFSLFPFESKVPAQAAEVELSRQIDDDAGIEERGVQSRSIECLKRETPPASTESPQAKGGQIARLTDLDIRQLEEAEVIPRQLQQADVSAFPGPDCAACANTGRANPHQHLQIVQIGVVYVAGENTGINPEVGHEVYQTYRDARQEFGAFADASSIRSELDAIVS